MNAGSTACQILVRCIRVTQFAAPAELLQAQKERDAQTSIWLSICQILRATSAERETFFGSRGLSAYEGADGEKPIAKPRAACIVHRVWR